MTPSSIFKSTAGWMDWLNLPFSPSTVSDLFTYVILVLSGIGTGSFPTRDMRCSPGFSCISEQNILFEFQKVVIFIEKMS
jgi:hypothetical protein